MHEAYFKKNVTPTRRFRPWWLCLLALSVAGGGSLSAQTILTWGPNGSGAPAGGDGVWNAANPFWTANGGASYNAWPGAGYTAVFSGIGGTVDLNGNITAAGLRFDSINYALNFSGAGNSLTLVGNAGFAPRIDGHFWRPGFSIATVINGALAGTEGVNFGSGAIGLAGNNTITGGINIGGATVSLLASPGAFLASNTLTMGATIADGGRIGGGGTFIYDGMNATASTTQTFSALNVVSGDANVQTNWNGVGTITLNFGSQTRAAGATVAYYGRVNPGFIGTDNKINITSQAAGFIDYGTFFNTDAVTYSADYAWKDTAGYLRQINYGTDAGTATNGATTSINTGANSYFRITGNISAQATATMKTLKISGNRNLTLANGATLTVSGLLKTGGDESSTNASTIGGGAAIRANAGDEFIVRADQIGDTLTINTAIVDNGTTSLVKSGFGTLILGAANSYGGPTIINGGAIRLSNAVALPSTSNVRFNGGVLELTSSSANAFTVGAAGGQVQWAGDGGFSAFGSAVTLTLNSGAPLIWGATDFVPNGNALILGGGRSNNTLTLANDIDLGSVAREVRINFGTGPFLPASNATLSGKLTGSGGLVLTGGGSILLNNANTYTGGTRIIDATVIVGNAAALGTGPITFGGSQTGGLLMSNAPLTINNDLISLPDSSTPFQIGGTAALTFNGALSGNGLFYTTGTNTVTFNGNSPNFTGRVQLQNDVAIIGSDNAFGTGVVKYNVLTLQGNGAPRTISNPGLLFPITIGGASDLTFTGLLKNDYGGNMTLTVANAGVTTFGAIDLAAGTTSTFTFSVTGSSTALITGTIASGFNTTNSALLKSGTGTLSISSTSNTYAGATTITGGVLAVASLANGGTNSSIGKSSNAAANLVINGGTLRYTGVGSSTDRLFVVGQNGAGATATLDAAGTGAVSFTNAGALTFGTNNQTRTLVLTGSNTGNNSLAAVLNNNGSGLTSLIKNGAGTWVFSGGGNFSGATTVNAGLLILNGSSVNSAVTVVGGAISGTGTIGTLSVQSGGAVAPGTPAATGTLNSKAFSLLSGGALKLKLGGLGAGAFDQVSVTGTVSLSGDAQISLFGSYTPGVGDKFFVIVNDGADAVTGTFSNANGANQIVASGVTYLVNYADNFGGSGAGNDVSLTVSGVPEPSTGALVLAGLGALVGWRRRR